MCKEIQFYRSSFGQAVAIMFHCKSPFNYTPPPPRKFFDELKLLFE